jgi:hypothetical protein
MTLEQNKPSNTEVEKLKLLYEENATQFRYFLTWRQLLLAGYFSIIAALALGFKWALGRHDVAPFVFPLAGAIVSVFFWALDFRNRELYQVTGRVGSDLEERLELKGMGHFSAYLSSSCETKFAHSKILKIFYLGCGILMFLIAAFMVFANLMGKLFFCW